MPGNGFRGVEWIPAHTKRYLEQKSRKIDAIVLHCTDGKAVDAGRRQGTSSAHPPEWDARLGQYRAQSAHYIVGRDGSSKQDWMSLLSACITYRMGQQL
jgi:hypothetical protein